MFPADTFLFSNCVKKSYFDFFMKKQEISLIVNLKTSLRYNYEVKRANSTAISNALKNFLRQTQE